MIAAKGVGRGAGDGGVLGELHVRDRAGVDFVRPVGEPQGALVGIGRGEAVVLRHAAAAMRLDGIVDDLQGHVGRLHLDHRDFLLGRLVADLVHHVGGLEAQQAGHLDVDAGARNALFPDRVLVDRLAEGLAFLQAAAHLGQRLFGDPDGAHAVVDAARPEAALRDFEAAPFAQQHVADRDAHVHHLDFHVAVRGIVIAEHRQVADDVHARRVDRHQHHRLLRVALRREVGLAHHDRDLAARIAEARGPPLAPVDHVMIAVALDPSFDVRRVRGGGVGLGHQEGRTDLAVHQRTQPLFLLLAGAVAVEHFHVAGVGRGAVEHFRRPADAAHFLGAQGVFEVGEARAFEFEGIIDMVMAVVARRHEQVPDAGVLGQLLLVLDDLDHLPAITFGVLRLVDIHVGAHVRLDEIAHTIAPVDLAFGGFEIHGVVPLSSKIAGRICG